MSLGTIIRNCRFLPVLMASSVLSSLAFSSSGIERLGDRQQQSRHYETTLMLDKGILHERIKDQFDSCWKSEPKKFTKITPQVYGDIWEEESRSVFKLYSNPGAPQKVFHTQVAEIWLYKDGSEATKVKINTQKVINTETLISWVNGQKECAYLDHGY